MIVTGAAGTGKSHTIFAIATTLGLNKTKRVAFTGKAAQIIKGSTIHSAMDIPVDRTGTIIFN